MLLWNRMPAQVNVSHILVSKEKAALLDECEQQLKAGTKTFEELAMAHSECPTRAKGGAIGWLVGALDST